jgi:hypothetical protein
MGFEVAGSNPGRWIFMGDKNLQCALPSEGK